MNTFARPQRQAGSVASSRLAFGSIIALVALSAACSDISPTHPASAARSSSGIRASDKNAPATSTGFTVLGNAAVTCTNGSIVGDVGTFQAAPTGAVVLTSCPVTGTVHLGDAAAQRAYNDFLTAYAALAPAPSNCTVETGTLAGVTLPPGNYCFPAAATLTGTLTLDGPSNATWTFEIGTGGTGALTGTNFTVAMLGGGQACNVTWWVAQAVTMTTSAFQGNILAGAAITFTGGTFNGNLWSQAGVTVTGATGSGCAQTANNGGGGGGGGQKQKCNQGVGNGPEGCDPGNSDHHNGSNDENGGTPGNPGRSKS